MAGMKALLLLAFMGSIGMACVIIACAIHASWWPIIVVLFYILAPLPTIGTRGYNSNERSTYMDLAIFITMGIVVSSFALPIVMMRSSSEMIQWDACCLTLFGNIVIYATYVGYSLTLFPESGYL